MAASSSILCQEDLEFLCGIGDSIRAEAEDVFKGVREGVLDVGSAALRLGKTVPPILERKLPRIPRLKIFSWPDAKKVLRTSACLANGPEGKPAFSALIRPAAILECDPALLAQQFAAAVCHELARALQDSKAGEDPVALSQDEISSCEEEKFYAYLSGARRIETYAVEMALMAEESLRALDDEAEPPAGGHNAYAIANMYKQASNRYPHLWTAFISETAVVSSWMEEARRGGDPVVFEEDAEAC